MGLEFQLNKICKEKASLDEMLAKTMEGMKRLKEREEVRPPFTYAVITPEGYQSINP
jgi:hypothetical protein